METPKGYKKRLKEGEKYPEIKHWQKVVCVALLAPGMPSVAITTSRDDRELGTFKWKSAWNSYEECAKHRAFDYWK